VYLALGIWGWWAWVRGGNNRAPLPVGRTTPSQWMALVAASIAGTVFLTWLLGVTTDSTVPFWDALTTVISIAATWGQCLKKIESWYLWLAVDAIYIPLYGSQHLGLTAVLYGGFFVMCLAGLRDWHSELSVQDLAFAPSAL
jgi:nicotinamide mononucleotide transporter